jgi:ribosomal protein S27E
MKVNCIACGHNMTLDDAYDDFEGLVKCYVCGTLLQVKTSEGKIKAVNIAGTEYQPATKKTEVDLESVR